jgi:hypothetical protein
MKIIVFIFLSLCASCFCGSDDDAVFCSEEFVYGLNITCKNESGEILTEGLTLVAVDGNYQETLMVYEGFNTFVGAGERAGNYVITVTSDNYQTYTSEVITLEKDQCHVIPKGIEFVLQSN